MAGPTPTIDLPLTSIASIQPLCSVAPGLATDLIQRYCSLYHGVAVLYGGTDAD
jgi:hypothetical protein